MATAITKEVCAILSSNVYDSDDCVPITKESDWQVLIKASDLAQTTENYDIISPSFGATAYYNSKTNELIIAYRGSENDLDDWINNNFGGWGCDKIPNQFYDANNFYDTLKEKIDNGDFETQIGKNKKFDDIDNVGLTGHSLGGGLAELMGALKKCENYQTYCFNGIGGTHLLNNLKKDGQEISDNNFSNIHNYMVRGDIVSSLFPHFGNDLNYVKATHPTLQKFPVIIKGTLTFFYTVTNEINIKGTHGWDNFIGDDAFQETIPISTYATVFGLLEETQGTNILIHGVIPLPYYVKNLISSTKKGITNGSKKVYNTTKSGIIELINKAKGQGCTPHDPIIFDLNNDGVLETTDINHGVYFDHDNDGFAEASAWVGENDGILVIDTNSNDEIDNGTEIIKTETVSQYDTNEDGIINADDTDFANLKILRGDGTLLTLSDAGIQSINLTTAQINDIDKNGNEQVCRLGFNPTSKSREYKAKLKTAA